jgi:hypothetical protein
LMASVEGHTRLIGTALVQAHGPDRGIRAGLHQLAADTGFPLRTEIDAIDGVIIDARPLSLLLIGERPDGDAHALSAVRGLGVVRYFHIPSVPPQRADAAADWPAVIFAAWLYGSIDAILVDVPDGQMPVWAAHLFNALNTTPNAPPTLVLAAEVGIAELAPWHARVVMRGDNLPERLASALAETQSARLLSLNTAMPASVFRNQAIVTAMIAAQRAEGGRFGYIDIASGTTTIVAAAERTDLAYHADLDCGAGAPALLAPPYASNTERWLPTGVDIESARRWAVRRAAGSAAVLTDTADRAMAVAFARTLATRAGESHSLATAATIILGPGWLQWATGSEMLAVMADAIAPPTPVQIALDSDDLLAAAGFIARIRPESAESIYSFDTLRPIGTVIALPARAQRNAPAVHVVLTTSGHAERREIPAEGVLRMRVDERATLEISRAGDPTQSHTILPSEEGLIVDTRRRPLTAAGLWTDKRVTVGDRLRVMP